jgi:Spy/CpxP family protein refolding chaperone
LLTVTAAAQSPQDPQPNSPSQGSAPDLLEQLRLTPEQQQKIRQIQRDTKDERSVIGLRLRESNRALEDALDAEVLDDSLNRTTHASSFGRSSRTVAFADSN